MQQQSQLQPQPGTPSMLEPVKWGPAMAPRFGARADPYASYCDPMADDPAAAVVDISGPDEEVLPPCLILTRRAQGTESFILADGLTDHSLSPQRSEIDELNSHAGTSGQVPLPTDTMPVPFGRGRSQTRSRSPAPDRSRSPKRDAATVDLEAVDDTPAPALPAVQADLGVFQEAAATDAAQ